MQSAVILLAAKNPRDVLNGTWERLYQKNINRMTKFTQEQGVNFWQLDSEVGINSSDFHDASHMNNQDTQLRYRDALAERIAAEFSDREKETGL